MKLGAILLSLVVCLTLLSTASLAEDTQKRAGALMDRARQLSDIRSPKSSAFRLKATFSFVGEGLDTIHGSYTELWVSSSRWWRETVAGNFRRTEVGGINKRWLLDNTKDFPEQAARVPALMEMFPPRFARFEFESITGSTPADAPNECAISKPDSLHRVNAFCFDTQSGMLVEKVVPELLPQQVADYSCRYGAFQKFGNHWFPREMACFVNGHQKMEANVAELSTEAAPDLVLFKPPAEAIEIGSCTVNAAAPRPVFAPDPMLPRVVRDQNSAVALWMVVDTKGKPQELKVVRSGGKSFDEEALSTVRRWRFKPGTCNGEPMQAEINVEVRFRRMHQ